MVQILPPKKDIGQSLTQGFAEGFQGSFQPAAQQGYQRGQIHQALSSLENLPQNATPQQVTSAVIKATAGIPGAERYVGPLVQTLTERARANQTPDLAEMRGGGIGVQGQAPNMQQPQQQIPGGQVGAQGNAARPKNYENLVLAEGEEIKLGNFIPYNLGNQISPEQRMSILNDVKKKGGDVDFTRDQIDQYNSGKISQTDLANANVDKKTAQQQRQFAQEAQIAEYLGPKLPEDTDESTKVLYQHMMAQELPKSKGMDQAFLKTQKGIQNFIKQRDTWIKNVPDGNMFGITSSQAKQLYSSAKPMLTIDPVAYNILESSMVGKGNSIIDASHVLKPVTPELYNILNKAVDYREYIYPKFNISDRAMERNISEAQDRQSKEVPKLAKEFEKIWKSDVSLLNIYTDLSKKGWFPEQINELFDELSPNFDSQQQVEHTQLNKHPRIPVRYLVE